MKQLTKTTIGAMVLLALATAASVDAEATVSVNVERANNIAIFVACAEMRPQDAAYFNRVALYWQTQSIEEGENTTTMAQVSMNYIRILRNLKVSQLQAVCKQVAP